MPPALRYISSCLRPKLMRFKVSIWLWATTQDAAPLLTQIISLLVLKRASSTQSLSARSDSVHQTDCIAISGLSSHAFGSWQPRGPDKSFMWIRDEIPRCIPGVRTIVYGYDSNLINTTSFQTIKDIARCFVHQLDPGGWNLESAKPLVFLAHSLGGLVLKQAIVLMANNKIPILEKIKGAIMFGVPNFGMEVSHLMAMTKHQANDALIQDLSRRNVGSYLKPLHESFDGLIFVRHILIYWAYETKETPTPKKLPNGKWNKDGPLALLVNPDSATCHHDVDDETVTIPIDEDHSNMVKFSRGNATLPAIIATLRRLCSGKYHDDSPMLTSQLHNLAGLPGHFQNEDKTPEFTYISYQDRSMVTEMDKLDKPAKNMYEELDSPELNIRIEQIENPYNDTFRWIFEQPVFCNWLQEGSGLFWIHGKPGSGKSTLMKYIYESENTWQLVHDWRRGSYGVREVRASFFFHYRGSSVQKSMEGLLRSLLIQLLSPELQVAKRRWQTRASLKASESTWVTQLKNANASLGQAERGEGGVDVEKFAGEKNEAEAELSDIGKELTSLAKEFGQVCVQPQHQFLLELSALFQEWGKDGFLNKLERALCYILDHDIMRMDLLLFFDALDEFDGHLDMISRFLKSLTQFRDASKTRVKVCFSSRPWETFKRHFLECPNLCMQDHTGHDIETYSVGTLLPYRISYPGILELTPIILGRANGVFLWVKLAINELVDILPRSTGPLLREKLEKRIYELPEDLDGFYQLIIERISSFYRQSTYVLLELVVRHKDDDKPLTLLYVWEAVRIALCSSYQKAASTLKNKEHEHSMGEGSENQRQKTDIAIWSGGLVETQQGFVQVMHQTVLEFVMRDSFKEMVLGNLANLVAENGHSYHFKYKCMLGVHDSKPEDGGIVAYHAEQAELTTGISQLDFIISLPVLIVIRLLGMDVFNNLETGLLSLVARYGLSLCLRDWTKRHPRQLDRLFQFEHSLLLISSLLYRPYNLPQFLSEPDKSRYYMRRVSMARGLLTSGYGVDHEPGLFNTMVLDICAIEGGEGTEADIPLQQLYEAIELFLEHGQDPNPEIRGYGPALHLGPPKLANRLLEYGADPNSLNLEDRTPLDYALDFQHIRPMGPQQTIQSRYSKCMLLIDAGGLPSKTNYNSWINALDLFERDGHDITALRESEAARKMDKLNQGTLASLLGWFARSSKAT
ncbi:unnamed protein product [Clonostachys solani]|uniref:Nephrocystin 3-like N-terminal domain-containing protein n=1 Tax=Clonostachys solani TaxID=160281 RepID=A0A9N9W690_9HYPO|nr:unnamed protein product [Clonostachys solani]